MQKEKHRDISEYLLLNLQFTYGIKILADIHWEKYALNQGLKLFTGFAMVRSNIPISILLFQISWRFGEFRERFSGSNVSARRACY